MTGGILQLMSYGNLDKIFIENPEITFFKKSYRKPTLFSIEHVNIPINLNNNNLVNTHNIEKIGDLLKSVNLKINLPSVYIDYNNRLENMCMNYLNNSNYNHNIESSYDNYNKSVVMNEYLYYNIIKTTMTNEIITILKNNKPNDNFIIIPLDNNTIKIEMVNNDILSMNLIHYENDDDINSKTKTFYYDLKDITMSEDISYLLKLTSMKYDDIDYNSSNYLKYIEKKDLYEMMLIIEKEYKNSSLGNYLMSKQQISFSKVKNYITDMNQNKKLRLNEYFMVNTPVFPIFSLVNNYAINRNIVSTQNENWTLNKFNDFMSKLTKGLKNKIIKNKELYYYNEIINTPISEITSYTTNDIYMYNIYVENTNIQNYPNKFAFIVNDNNIVISVIEINKYNLRSQYLICTLLENDFDRLYNDSLSNMYISCSILDNNYLNYVKYYNVTKITKSMLSTDGEKIVQFFINKDYKSLFTNGKYLCVFGSTDSKLPYCVLQIVESNYDINTNYTEIKCKDITVQELNTLNFLDNNYYIRISSYYKVKINKAISSSIHYDTINNYNNYIIQDKYVNGITNNEICTNLKNVLLESIKFNWSYILNLISNMFNSSYYFFQMIELFYDTSINNYDTSTFINKNTYLASTIGQIISYITDTTRTNSFLNRTIHDIEYNYLYDKIYSAITKLTQDYTKISDIFFANKFYNYDKNTINKYLNTISILTQNIDKLYNNSTEPTTINISNVKLKNIYTAGYLTVKSNNLINGITLATIKSTNYVINYNFNSMTNTNYDMITNNELKLINPIVINYDSKNNKIFIIDKINDSSILFLIQNNNIKNIFEKSISKLYVKEENIMTHQWNTCKNYKLNKILDYCIENRKYIIDNNNGVYDIYYINKFNNIILVEHYNFIPQHILNISNKYYVSGIYYGKNIILGISNGFNCTAKDNSISFLTDNMIFKDYNKTFIYDNIYFFVNNNKIILYDINYNGILETPNDKYKTKTNIIDLHFLFYESNYYELFNDELNYKFIDVDIIKINIYQYNVFITLNDIKKNITKTISFTIHINIDNSTLTYDIVFNNDLVETNQDIITFGQLNKCIKYTNDYVFYLYDNYLRIYGNIVNNYNYLFSNKPKLTYVNDNYLLIYYIDKNIDSISYVLKIYKLSDLINYINSNDNNSIYLDDDNIIESKVLTSEDSFIPDDIIKIYLNDKIYLVDNKNTYYKISIDNSLVCNKEYTYNINENYNIIGINEKDGKDYICTDKGIFIYDNSSMQLNNLDITLSSYSYKNENILIDYENKIFKIIDNNSRIIYGKYIYSGDKLIFNDINSYNISKSNSKILFNKFKNINTDVFILTDNHITNLYYSDSKYGIKNTQIINDDFINSQFFYIYDNTLYYLLNNNLYKISLLFSYFTNPMNYVNGEFICEIKLNHYETIINMTVSENIYFQINNSSFNRDRIVILNITTGNYSDYIGINNAINMKIMPYKIENCYLDKISNICIFDDVYVIQNNNDLYYIYDDNIIRLNRYNGIVQDICNVKNTIYIKISTSITEIDLNNLNEVQYNINDINIQNYYKMYPLMYSSDINFNNIIIIVTQYIDQVTDIRNYYINFYMKQINTLTKLNIMDSNKNLIEISYTEVKNISYEQIVINDNDSNSTKNVLYISNNNKIDISFIKLSPDNTIVYETSNNSYIDKNKVFSIIENNYTENININCPSLFCTDYYNSSYNKILLSNLQSKVTINDASNYALPSINNGYLYNINYMELANEKNIRKFIDTNTTIVTDDNNQLNVLINYEKTNDSIINENVETIDYTLSNTNSYVLSDLNNFNNTDFYDFHQDVIVYLDVNNVYMNHNVINKYTINGDNIDKIKRGNINVDDKYIKILYTIDTIKNNLLISSVSNIVINNSLNDSFELIDLTQTINLDYKFATTTNTTLKQSYTIDKYVYQGSYSIPIFKNVYIITKNSYFEINNLEYHTTDIEPSIIKIKYIINTDISNQEYNYNSYLYVKENKYYVGKIVTENGNNILEISIRNFDNIVWQCNNKDYYTSVLCISSYDTLSVYNNNYNNDSGQTEIYNDMNIFNGNLIKLDYLRYLRYTINSRDNTNINKRIYQETEYTINNIINDTFMNLSLIETNNEDIIINSNNRLIYKNIKDSINLTQYNRIYFKMSNNFSNIIGYTGINNYISNEFINKSLLKFHNALLEMFSDKNDIIIIKQKVISYYIQLDEYILWDIISTKNISNTIKYIYDYLKQMIILANEEINHLDFIDNNNDYSIYLYENISKFKQIYDNLIKTNYLISWDKIENVINYLYLSMQNINKLLHDKLVMLNGNTYYLINSNFNIEQNRYNKIIYLEQTSDVDVIQYVYDYINTIYNNYELLDVLNYEQQIVDLFYGSFDKIFNDESLGLTTQKYINNASDLLSYDFNNIYNNCNKLNTINKSPSSCIFSNAFLPQKINQLSLYFIQKDKSNNNNLKFYNQNSNILSISKIDVDTLQNKYNNYINTKNAILIKGVTLTIDSENNNYVILELYRLENIIKYNYIGFVNPSTQKYNIYTVIFVDYNDNKVKIKVDDINNYNNLKTETEKETGKKTEIFVNIDCLKFTNYKKNIYSSNEIARALCCELFNDLNSFDNINYKNNQNWNYYDESTKKIKYFESKKPDNETNYDKIILSKLNKNYAISDMSILRDTFNNIFTINATLSTIENFTYNIIQFINPYKITGNNLYDHIYLIYKLSSVINNNSLFDDFININNLQYIVNDVNNKLLKYYGHYNVNDNKYYLGPQTKNKKDIMLNNFLKIINKTSDSSKFKYNIINNILISKDMNNDNDTANNNENFILVTNDKYNSNVYPYCNCTYKLNIESNLINYQINDTVKLNDIKLNIDKIKNYYVKKNDGQTYTDVINNIYYFDSIKSNFAYEKIKDTLSFNFSKFDLFNNKNDQNTNKVLFYRNSIIDYYERIGYYKLKFQQLIIWKFLTKINTSINNPNNFYSRKPRSHLYLYNTNYIDTLSNDQLTSINNTFNSFINKLLLNKNIIGPYNSNNNNIWNDIINETDKNFDNISNLVLPCDYCYIAYLIVKSIPLNMITKNTQFMFPTVEYKIDYNVDNLISLKYTDEIVKFLLVQKNKSYDINDWIGTFDINQNENKYKVDKVHLCNIINLDTIFVSVLSNLGLYDSDSGIGTIKMINYILSTILNCTGNCVESVYENKLIYPTLYLTNGLLVRITELPECYYYNDDNNCLEIKRVNLVKNGINYYGIVQNDISNFIKKSYNKRIAGYDKYIGDEWTNNIYNFEMENICIKYKITKLEYVNQKIKVDVNDIIMSTYGEIKIINSNDFIKYIYDKCYCVTDNNDYLYIDLVEFDGQYIYLTINQNLSKIKEELNDYKYINGGLYNIIDNIYLDKELRYIFNRQLYDNYDDYFQIFDYSINVMGQFLNQININTDTMSTTLYQYILSMSEYLNRYKSDDWMADFITINNLTLNKQLEVNNMVDTMKIVNNNINYVKSDINEKKSFNDEIVTNITNNIKFPIHTIYNPKPLQGKWTKYLGHNIIDYVEMKVGDQVIQKITGDYLHINYSLFSETSKKQKYLENIGYVPELLKSNNILPNKNLYIYLPWFFSKSGTYLPLISLLYTNVSFKIKYKKLDDLILIDGGTNNYKLKSYVNGKINDDIMLKSEYMTEYIYLGDDERLKFAQSRHEYIIEQIQYLSPIYVNSNKILDLGSETIKINFNNCGKDLYWYCKTDNNILNKDYCNYTMTSSSYNNTIDRKQNINLFKNHLPDYKIALKKKIENINFLNINVNEYDYNIDWFYKSEQSSIVKMLENISEYADDGPIIKSSIILNGKTLLDHDNMYTTSVIPMTHYKSNNTSGLHVHTFALHPTEAQPSGDFNYSTIDDIKLKLTFDKSVAINNKYISINGMTRTYNIFRVFSGYGACVY